ncbi:GTPase IMAP family member 7-like [Halichoeres trimaculatus]|uniref:GTPase IMAP family member 7-like n=1 Tax=Halichoeres trimaculatus TaxID=147232 RepID=UPI003D9EE7C6
MPHYLHDNSCVTAANTQRVVILGKTGSGKSSLANTIFGEDVFKINHTPSSETSKCQTSNASVKGRKFTLVDTPGFFDTKITEDEMKPEILRCTTECAPGPHAVLIVLKVEKSSEQEKAVIDKIKEYCSEEVFRYAIVVFTHGDQLSKGQKIEDFVQQNDSLRELVEKCGDRCHVIDSKYWNKRRSAKKKKYRSNKFQVKQILKTLDQMVAEHKRDYTNDLLQEVEKEIQQEEGFISQSSNMSKEEIREKAKDKVFEKLLIRLVGTTTGALLGALFGVAAMTTVVISIMKTATAGDDAVARRPGESSSVFTMPVAVTGALVGVATGIAPGILGGGMIGYHASKRASTSQEAAMMAMEAVVDGTENILEKTTIVLNKLSQKQIKHDSLR